MRFIHHAFTDPAFNLAAEEWLLRNAETDVFMLWRNAPAVIVGRNQNTLSQISESFVRERGIPVIRRLTGGGAVFHDLGNLNFTFISPGHETPALDFRRFTEPVIAAMRTMGVDCEFDGRNDLTIQGRKFSGNAQHVLRDRVLHHGTLLFASEIADLSGALRVDPEKYRDKAVKSVQRRVTNISSHLVEPMSVTEFAGRLMAHVSGGAPLGDLDLRADEIRDINRLADSRYRTWDWNYGASPKYGFTRSTRTPGGLLEVHMEVRDGIIAGLRLFGEYFGVLDIAGLEDRLIGCRHDREAMAECLADVDLDQYMRGVDLPAFFDCLF